MPLTHYQAIDNELSSETIIPNLDEDLKSMADSFADSDLRSESRAVALDWELTRGYFTGLWVGGREAPAYPEPTPHSL